MASIRNPGAAQQRHAAANLDHRFSPDFHRTQCGSDLRTHPGRSVDDFTHEALVRLNRLYTELHRKKFLEEELAAS
jgi:hypothetical protein